MLFEELFDLFYHLAVGAAVGDLLFCGESESFAVQGLPASREKIIDHSHHGPWKHHSVSATKRAPISFFGCTLEMELIPFLVLLQRDLQIQENAA